MTLRTQMALVPALAVLMLIASCGSRSPEALIEDARQALAKGDPGSAVVNLKSALVSQPTSIEARQMLAQALIAGGDFAGATIELRKLLEARPDLDNAVPLLARSLNGGRQYSRVVSEFSATELQDPAQQAELLAQVALAHLALGNGKRAAEAAKSSLDLDPKNARALQAQARLAAAAGDSERALKLLEAASAADPKDAAVHYARGMILYLMTRDIGGAKSALLQAIAIEPRNLEARVNLVALQIFSKDLKGAKDQLSFLQSLGKDSLLATLVEAQIAYAEKDYDKALSRIQVALKSHPDTFQVVSLAGMVQLQKGQLSQAERSLTHALHLQPNSALVGQHLAQLYLRTGNVEKALEILRPLLSRPNASGGTLALAGAVHMRRGEPDKAAEYLANAVRLNPQDPLVRTQLALAQAKSQPVEKTAAELSAISASDQSTVADLALVSVLLEAKQYGAAAAAVDAVERKLPRSPIAHNLRGFVLLQQQDRTRARQSFEQALALDPKFFPALSSLAGIDVSEKRVDAAIARYESFVKSQPDHLGASTALAQLLSADPSSKERVIQLLAATIRSHTGSPAPRLILIERLLAARDSPAALSAAQEADAAIPNHPEILDALGRAQHAMGQRQAAVTTYGKLVSLQPGSATAHTKLAGAYLANNDRKMAAESLRKALTIDAAFVPAQQALISMAQLDSRFDDAVNIARSVVKQRPDSPVGYLMAGAIEVNRGNDVAAASIYRDGLKRVADTKLAASLYSVLVKSKQAAEADKFSRQWLSQQPKDVEFLGFLADSALARKEWPLAERHLLAMLELQPDHVSTLNNLAWVALQQGRRDGLKHAERANQLRPDTPGLLDTLAASLALAGDLKRALETQNKAIALAPNDQGLRLHLAKIQLQRGDKQAAKTELLALQKLGDRIPAQAEVQRLLKEAN